jgi:Domain of unknown function (DUF927)
LRHARWRGCRPAVPAGAPPACVRAHRAGATSAVAAGCHLHGGGALGADGPVPDVDVDLPPALAPPRWSRRPTGWLRSPRCSPACGCSSSPRGRHRAAAGRRVAQRARPRRLGVWLTGGTGAGKSQLAALAQAAHFSAGFPASTLPGSWSSTGNALEELAFLSKDALLVIDDFAPTGNAGRHLGAAPHRRAVIRTQGNGAGRARMSRDLKVQAPRPPRGTLGTGPAAPGRPARRRGSWAPRRPGRPPPPRHRRRSGRRPAE